MNDCSPLEARLQQNINGMTLWDAIEQVNNLERALTTSRTIGMAMGILMVQDGKNPDGAFNKLRIASQHLNKKLSEVARFVVATGTLPESAVEVERIV